MTVTAKRYWGTAAAILLIGLFIALSSFIAMKKSNTWDEPAHIMAGYAYLAEGMDYLSPLNHPVAGRSLAAMIPSLFLELDFDSTVEPEGIAGSRFFPYSLKFLYENRTNGETVLFLSRLSNILLGAILGVYVYAWAKRLWGKAGGLLSLFIFALSPDMLAHSSLATTDLPATAFFFITAYYLYRTADEGLCAKKTLLGAFFFALCLATKHTAVLLVPFILAANFFAWRKAGVGKTVIHLVHFAALAYFFLWGVYAFSHHSSAQGYMPPDWSIFGPSGASRFLKTLSGLKFLPESYLYGLAGSIAGAGSGRAAFFMGEYSTDGWALYFTTAFLLKTPVSAIVLLSATIVYLMRERVELQKAVFVMLPPIIVFIAFSSQKVNIGLRHVLPAYPFIFLLTGYAANIKTESKRAARTVLCSCFSWYVYAAVSVFPHQLAYFNEFAGGSENGYKYLVDSNLDWGQDLPALREFMNNNGIKRIKLAYFGFCDPRYFGVEYDYLPSYYIPEPVNVKERVELKGWFAISATMLQGVYLSDHDFYKVFRDIEPVAAIGYSTFIYRL